MEKEQHSANRAEQKNVLSLQLICQKSQYTQCFPWFMWTKWGSELQRVLIAHCSPKQPHTVLFHPALMITDGSEGRISKLFMLAAADNWTKRVKLLSGPSTSLEHKDKHWSLFAACKLPPRTQLPQVQLFPCKLSGTEEDPSFSTPKSLESWWPDF